MEPFTVFNFIALWLVVLLLLWLSLRLLRERSIAQKAPAKRAVPAEKKPLLGRHAPAFTAFTLDQQRVTHADYLGKETLFLFLGTTCPHCRNVLPEIERVGARLLSRGGSVACVFAADAKDARAYASELGLTLPILLAPKQESSFSEDYNRSGGVPAFVAVNSEGIVTHEGVVNRRQEAWRAFVNEWQVYPTLAKDPALYR